MALIKPRQSRTVPISGQLDMGMINTEFWGRGTDFNSYRNTLWYTDAGDSGYFSGGQLAISEFYGKRPDYPGPPPAGPGAYIVVPGNASAFAGHLTTGTPHPSRVMVCTVASGDSTSNTVVFSQFKPSAATAALPYIEQDNRVGIIAILIGLRQLGTGPVTSTALPGSDTIAVEVNPGDGGLGLLLPAVQKVRAAAARL